MKFSKKVCLASFQALMILFTVSLPASGEDLASTLELGGEEYRAEELHTTSTKRWSSTVHSEETKIQFNREGDEDICEKSTKVNTDPTEYNKVSMENCEFQKLAYEIKLENGSCEPSRMDMVPNKPVNLPGPLIEKYLAQNENCLCYYVSKNDRPRPGNTSYSNPAINEFTQLALDPNVCEDFFGAEESIQN